MPQYSKSVHRVCPFSTWLADWKRAQLDSDNGRKLELRRIVCSIVPQRLPQHIGSLLQRMEQPAELERTLQSKGLTPGKGELSRSSTWKAMSEQDCNSRTAARNDDDAEEEFALTVAEGFSISAWPARPRTGVSADTVVGRRSDRRRCNFIMLLSRMASTDTKLVGGKVERLLSLLRMRDWDAAMAARCIGITKMVFSWRSGPSLRVFCRDRPVTSCRPVTEATTLP